MCLKSVGLTVILRPSCLDWYLDLSKSVISLWKLTYFFYIFRKCTFLVRFYIVGDVCLTSLNERVMSVVFKSRSSTAQNPHDVTWKVNQSLNRLRVDAFFFFFFKYRFLPFSISLPSGRIPHHLSCRLVPMLFSSSSNRRFPT